MSKRALSSRAESVRVRGRDASCASWASWFAPILFGGVVLVAAAGVACSPQRPGGIANPVAGEPPLAGQTSSREGAHGLIRGDAEGRLMPERIAMIALDGSARVAAVGATGEWSIDEQGGREPLVRGRGGEAWRIEQRGSLLRVAGDGGDATPWRQGPFVARAGVNGSFLRYANRRYRGELVFVPTDTGLLVVNRLPVEDYLRGVVPIEIGTRQPSDLAAIEAQAIAARSYSYMRVPPTTARQPERGWHMTAGVQNQVYAGMDVEHPLVNSAIDATVGLVLHYGGLIVDAPYFSSCGGRTASPREAWRDAREEPYLQPVDDIDPRTGKPYCDISPRNHWQVQLDEPHLREVVQRALRTAGARNPRSAVLKRIDVNNRTASGRAANVVLATDRGSLTVGARDIRSVLTDSRGVALPSTYFTVDHESQAGGRLTEITLRGSGYGHGVGMCQWGAIGRSRAGMDARTILRHYYPGTVVGFAE